MAILLSHPLTPQEIRVLQEFRRLATDTMALAAIQSIKHPGGGGGEAPARTLAGKGFLTADETGGTFTLTEKAKEFLSVEPKPETAASSPAAPPAGE